MAPHPRQRRADFFGKQRTLGEAGQNVVALMNSTAGSVEVPQEAFLAILKLET